MCGQLPMVILLATIGAGSTPADDTTRVNVYINDCDDSALLLRSGELLAGSIFEKIDVHLNWRTGQVPATRGAARDVTLSNVFEIRTLQHALQSASPDALASARIAGWSGAEITVYKDRLQRFLDCHRNLPGIEVAGVGYVLAHELAHVMQGIPRHSQVGILKAEWSNADIQEMIYHTLDFTAFDAALIHRGLDLQRQKLRSETRTRCHVTR
jgi:hypothetical protein